MIRITASARWAFFLSVSLVGLIGCNTTFFSIAPPTITSFTANPTAITGGGTSSLTGVFSEGTGVITPGNIAVTSGTAVSVTPATTTTYILTVTGKTGGTSTQMATVTVNPAAPSITSFVANPTSIALGGSTSLTGVFTNGTGVITPGNITVTSGTAVSVSPTDTTTYTLTVTNSSGVTSQQTAMVTVSPAAPTITSFTANHTSVAAGTSVNLTGVFANGTGVITPGNITATSGTPVSVLPTGTTTYTLTVVNSAGVVATRTATVIVTAVVPVVPTITSFTANPASITAGGTSQLTGVFAYGTGVITPGNITVSSGGATSVTPSVTTTYTLTVTNASGVTAAQTATVTVNATQPVLVTSITIPSTATVAAGATTTITPTMLPANATNKTVNWNSSDTTIAIISAAGVVTGVKQGSVTVTATAADGSGVVSNDCTVTVTAGTSAQSNYFGINIGTDLDWDTNRMFADAMKSSRAWATTSDTGKALPISALDANGWPTQDTSIYVWAGIDQMQGTYALSFNGQATVAPSSGSISNHVYNSSTNLTTATLTYTSSDSNYLTLTFTNTQRTSTSGTNTGITNVVLMRPSAVGSATPLASTQVFNPPFLAALSDFAALRTMDFSATNGNEIVHWSDRTRPGDASQAIGNPGVPAGGWEGPGGAWEYMVLLANTTGKDLWINVPLNADNDYITKLAQLMKYGSDGTTPYTSAQTSPVWPGLNPNLHLYVEFSNEVWNTAGAFAGTENHTEAVAEVNAGGSPLNFDGDTNDWYWAWRRPAEKTVQISTIFRSVWGDAAMMTTVRPVLESQLGYADGPLLQAMHLMVDYYYNPNQVSSPHPPNYYIYGLGGSAYYNPTDTSSVNQIFSTMATGFASAVQNDVDYALPFGLRRIAYEGGPSLDSTGNSSQDANQAAAWADSRMEQVIVTEQNAWSQANGDLLVYFYLAGTKSNPTGPDYQWAFMSDVLSPTSPKMSGIADILASPRSASTYGTPIPATLAASSANVPPAWMWSDGSNTQMHDYKWTGFSVLVSTQGTFNVSLTASTATANAEAEIFVDGNSIGTVTVPSSGNTTALLTPTLLVGSHGILVRSLTGTFNLTQVVVQSVQASGTAQTITFTNPGTQTVGTPLTLTATASSGLNVSFASTTTSICTVSGTAATFIAAGNCSITASQPGNSTYAAAASVSQSFTVNAATGGNPVAYSSCPSPAGSGVAYTIGMLDNSGQPSGPQTIADFTHWNNLNPGDVVCIYGKSTPYAERLVLTRSGSDEQHRIRIVGVNQGGYVPILTGKSATTADAFNYGTNMSQNFEGGEVSIMGLNYGTPVAYLNIEGLTIQGATTAEVSGTVANPIYSVNTYSDPNINSGTQSPWGCGSAGINLLRSDHISIIHNRIRDNDNGIFVNSNNGNTSSNILIEYNHIYGNGVFGEQQGAWNPGKCGADAHGTYSEAENITYLGNRFGALRQGEAVNLLKDRSSGLVVAYNLFLADGVFETSLGDGLLVGSKPGSIGHLLDLVESYDASVGPSGGLQSLGAAYNNVSVYGNIFFDDGAAADGSQGAENAVHFGGDQGDSTVYRKHLHFYNNTVVARRGDGVGWLEMEPTTDAGAWNNIFYAAYVGSSTPPSFNLLSTWCYDKQYGFTCGTVNYLSQNWNSPIWATTGVNGSNSNPNFVNLANYDVHIATNDPTIVGNGQTGDSSYPANSTTVPIEYADFLTTIPRPFSQTKIDLGALGH